MSQARADIVTLLSSKNRCLERLLDICLAFLPRAVAGDFSGLQEFHARRASIFKALELHDRKVSELVASIPGAERTPELTVAVRRELSERDRLTHAIAARDHQIMSAIEREKSRLLDQLAASRRGQALMSRFKSGWIAESGEELDTTL